MDGPPWLTRPERLADIVGDPVGGDLDRGIGQVSVTGGRLHRNHPA